MNIKVVAVGKLKEQFFKEALKEYGLIDGYRKTYAPIKDMIEEM